MAQDKKGGSRGRGKADDDTGIAPVSRDGEGGGEGLSQEAKDELARKRAEREKSEAGNGGGGSVATRAEQEALATGDEAPVDEEDDGQLFVWEQGRKVTLGTLIARGTPVEHAFVFGGKRLKGKGGLMGFDEDALVIVRGRLDKVAVVPTRDSDEKVTKVVIETHVAAKTLVNADSDEGLGMLAGVLDSHGYVKKDAAA
jgi:hypothetical protein